MSHTPHTYWVVIGDVGVTNVNYMYVLMRVCVFGCSKSLGSPVKVILCTFFTIINY